MSVIVQSSPGHYGGRMPVALLRIITLLALVLMPFGMTLAPATAQPMPAGHSMARVGHCDDQADQTQAPLHQSQQVHCAMCAALPASPPPACAADLQQTAPRVIAPVFPFDGIELEISTPPPRRG